MRPAVVFIACSTGAAPGFGDGAHFELRVQAMGVLLAWSILNLVVGGAGAAILRRRPLGVFLGANAAWNLVNLAIAAGGLWSALSHDPGSLVGIALLREVELFQKILLVNVGLDVGYVAAGVVTALWGRDRGDVWRTPIGLALVLQGLFLFVFDVVVTVMVGDQLDHLWTLI